METISDILNFFSHMGFDRHAARMHSLGQNARVFLFATSDKAASRFSRKHLTVVHDYNSLHTLPFLLNMNIDSRSVIKSKAVRRFVSR
jgi:hypothetical protein